MPTYSKVTELGGLYSSIYEGSLYVARQQEMIPNLVTRVTGTGMAPRIISRNAETTAGTVAEGVAPTSATLAKAAQGTVTPVIVHHQFALTDEMVATDPEDAARRAATEAGYALARYIDAAGVGVFPSFTSSLGAGGSALTLGRIAAAMTLLNQAYAPATRYAVIAPYAWHDVYTQVTNVSANPITTTAGDLANEALRQYFVSNMAGCRWFVNGNIGTSGTAGTVTNAVFAPTAIIYDVRTPITMEVDRDANVRATLLNWVTRFNYGIYDNTHGVKVLSRASAPA